MGNSNHGVVMPNFSVVAMPNHGLQFFHCMVLTAQLLQTNTGRSSDDVDHGISNALVDLLLGFGFVYILEFWVRICQHSIQGCAIKAA